MNLNVKNYGWGNLREKLYSDLNRPFMKNRFPDEILSKLKFPISNISKISIIITTRNRLSALKDYSLKSLEKLNFKNGNYEIIVVDNSSNAETYSYLKNLKNNKLNNLLILREKRKGTCYGRNKGIQYATGDIVVFIDDDCYVDKNWMNRIYSFYTKGDYLLGRGYIYDEKLKKIINPYKENEKEEAFFCGNLSFRKDIFNFVLFNESMTIYSEDSDLMSQIYLFWPNFNYFIDKKPIKHYSANSEYRDYGKSSLNNNGIKMDRMMLHLWIINKNTFQRNLNITNFFFSLNYILKESFFFPLELSFIDFDALRLVKTKLIIYRQLKKIKILIK